LHLHHKHKRQTNLLGVAHPTALKLTSTKVGSHLKKLSVQRKKFGVFFACISGTDYFAAHVGVHPPGPTSAIDQGEPPSQQHVAR
jgi:hypothetical protein